MLLIGFEFKAIAFRTKSSFLNGDIYFISTKINNDTSNKESLEILTEDNVVNPPILIHLTPINDVNAGNYNLVFVYTYFNGVEWIGQQKIVNIRINNFLERHPFFCWFAGILLALLTVVPIIIERIKWMNNVFGKIRNYYKGKHLSKEKTKVLPAKKTAK